MSQGRVGVRRRPGPGEPDSARDSLTRTRSHRRPRDAGVTGSSGSLRLQLEVQLELAAIMIVQRGLRFNLNFKLKFCLLTGRLTLDVIE